MGTFNRMMKVFLPFVLCVLLCLVFSGCDRTPPGPVTDFVAIGGDATVQLGWVNPADKDLAGVKIVRKAGSPPESPRDGAEVYDDSGESLVDRGLANGTKYFYAAWSYDGSGNLSNPVYASAIPISQYAQEEVLESFSELLEIINEESEITEEDKEELREVLAEADEEYRAGFPCEAAAVLYGKFLPITQSIRLDLAKGAAEDLYNLGRTLRYNIAMSMLSRDDCPELARIGIEAQAVVEEDTSRKVSGIGKFGEPLLTTLVPDPAGDVEEVYTQLFIPGVDSISGAPGAPGVPIFRRIIAAPRGEDVSVLLENAEPRTAEEFNVNLFPFQQQPLDQGPDPGIFANRPFYKDPEIYGSDDPWPPDPVTVNYLGNGRDMEFYLVEVATGQYFPKSNRLILYESSAFEVLFRGGDGSFMTEATLNPFEIGASPMLEISLNKHGLFANIARQVPQDEPGEEFMILTHPDFNEAAEALRDWKLEKGIITTIYPCGTGVKGRETAEDIDTFIHRRYYSATIRPYYILLLGDAEFIPTFYIDKIGTDWPYAVLGDPRTDTIPDFAVGRIPVDTQEEAQTVIDKIINYEKNPIKNSSFYVKAAIAAQFQCCREDAPKGLDDRTFIESSEFARDVMIRANKIVDRIYTKTGWQSGGVPPSYYFDGKPLPSDLGAKSGFEWDGSTADITNAWNEGRFLIMHRDHGWESGWEHPRYTTDNIDDLVNGEKLPVVFSVNCASGLFDNETADLSFLSDSEVYFVEKLLRKKNGGAVGVLGDTRNSPSWPNSVLTQGFFDAIWHSALPEFGTKFEQRQLGNILNHAKMYLVSQSGLIAFWGWIEEDSVREELYLWHCFGDPTMEIWTKNPHDMILPRLYLPFYKEQFVVGDIPYANGVNIEYPVEGAMLTVFLEGPDGGKMPLGRGIVKNGVASVSFLQAHDTRFALSVVAGNANAVSQTLSPQAIRN